MKRPAVRLALVGSLALVGLLSFGCGGGGGADVSDAEIAAATKEIREAPAQAEPILSRHGLDRESYEQALFDIAADPARSEQFVKDVGQR